jgi:tetratricopeptide (TPR) repeat protein
MEPESYNRPHNAREILKDLTPSIANYYNQKGEELLEKGDSAKAKLYFEKALIFNKNDDRIYNNLGFICHKDNDFECTQKNYQKALKINPKNYVAHYNSGGLYDDLGNFQQAEIQYKLAMQSDQSVGVNAQSDLARLQILKGDPATGIELSLEGLKKTDKINVQAALHKNLGWAYWMKTEYRIISQTILSTDFVIS